MSYLAGLFQAAAQNRSPLSDYWYQPVGVEAASGVQVSADTALKASAVWACVQVISQSVASLPLVLYQRLPNGGRERAIERSLYTRLHDEPNRRQTAFEYKEQQMTHLLLRGNAYSLIADGPSGPADQLVPLDPDRMRVEEVPTGRQLVNGLDETVLRYQYRLQNGWSVSLNAEDVLHLRGLTLDGVRGVSVITYARESIGLALASESYGARLFSQDARPGGVLSHPSKLTDSARKNLAASWRQTHQGHGRSHEPAILEEGMTWTTVSMTSEDAQFLGLRDFQVADVARWFRVPLHMINETTRNTSWGSGIEQMGIGFLVYTLLPWLRRWEQGTQRALVTDTRSYFAEFLVDALLRGDAKTRYETYQIGRTNGWLNGNDIRRLENLNPMGPEGDVYFMAANMTPLADALRPKGDMDVWMLNEKRAKDGLSPVPGGDAIFMPSGMIPVIEVEEASEGGEVGEATEAEGDMEMEE